MSENSRLPIDIIVSVDKASVGVAFADLEAKAASAGRKIGESMSKAMSQEKQIDKQINVDRYFKQAQAIDAVTEAARKQNEVFKQAKVRSPQDIANELASLRNAKKAWEAMGPAAEGYNGALAQITSRTNILTEGNARARGSFHKMTAALASLTFEITGALYGLGAIGAAFIAPILPGVGLSKTIEDTQLGMAAILVSMGRINGMTPTLPQALSVSSDMMSKLVADSLKYGVSIEAMANTLRATLAPGLGAGMTIKQIQEIATVGTIAVKTIGLDSKQTVQEIRDLVASGITAASSTLATSLGIKDSDIKRWREAGTLYEELMLRMKGFSSAAEESTKTLTGAWGVFTTKVALLMSSDEGFGALKGLLISISSYIGEIDEKTNKMVFNPALIESADSYWKTLMSIGEVLRSIGTVVEMLSPAIIVVAQTVSVMVAELSYMAKMVVGEIKTIATQAVALGHLDFAGAAAIGDEWTKSAYSARVEVDKLTSSILAVKDTSTKIKPASSKFSITGNADIESTNLLKTMEPLLKNTKEGILKEYEDTVTKLNTAKTNIGKQKLQLASMEKESLGLSGQALEDYKVNAKAKADLVMKLESGLSLSLEQAKKEKNAKLSALDKKGSAAAKKEIQDELKEVNKLYKSYELVAQAKIKASETRLQADLVNVQIDRSAGFSSEYETEKKQYDLKLATNEVTREALQTAYDQQTAMLEIVKVKGDSNQILDYENKLTATKTALDTKSIEVLQLVNEHTNTLVQSRKAEAEAIYASNLTLSDQLAGYEAEQSYIGKTILEVEKLKIVRDEANKLRDKIFSVDINGNPILKMSVALTEQELVTAEATKQARLEDAERQNSFAGGWASAFDSYYKAATNASQQAKDAFASSTKAMEDALHSFVTTGKVDFKSLLYTILDGLLKIQIQKTVAFAMGESGGSSSSGWLGTALSLGASYFTGQFSTASTYGTTPFSQQTTMLAEQSAGFKNGGVFANSPSLSAYSGSVYNSPQPFKFAAGAGVFGEAGPEAIMPLKRGSNGKLGVQVSGGSTGDVVVNVSVNVASDGSSSVQTDAAAQGKGLGDLIGNAVRAELVKEQRNGGLLDRNRR